MTKREKLIAVAILTVPAVYVAAFAIPAGSAVLGTVLIGKAAINGALALALA